MLITNSISIEAPPDVVWELTLDLERWPEITPTVTSVELLDPGPVTVGSRARLEQPRQRPRVWTVRELDAPHAFVWDTRVGSVTMTGRHRVDIDAAGDVRNTLELELSGFGSGLLGLLARRAVKSALAAENEGFRRAAEARTGKPASPAEHGA